MVLDHEHTDESFGHAIVHSLFLIENVLTEPLHIFKLLERYPVHSNISFGIDFSGKVLRRNIQ